jgi:hypothetical protein
MAKQPTPAPASKEPPINEALIRQDFQAATSLAVVQTEQNERVAALARELNYQGSTDPAVLENSAKDAVRRMGMAIFELGAYLLLLKEGCVHGQFAEVLKRLELNQHSSNKYMAVTRRFANSSTSTNLERLGFSKMAELLPLDDEQLEELTELGQTGELALDDIASMSVRELRLAARKARAEADKHKARAERQEAVNAELHEEVRLIKRLPPTEELKRIHSEAAEIQAELLGLVQGNLRQALISLNNCETDQAAYMAGMVGQLMAELAAVRDEFNLPQEIDTPEWERWALAQDAAPAGAVKKN